MPGYKYVAPEKKAEILKKAKEGQTIKELAKEYGFYDRTIYRWLREQTGEAGSTLELARLKRENEELLALIGSLTRDNSKLQKKLSKDV